MKTLTSTLGLIARAVEEVFRKRISTDIEVMSKEAKDILANPADREVYLEAIDKVNEEKKPRKITLSTGREIELVP